MKDNDIPRILRELRGIIQEFRQSPFRAAKALVILVIVVVCAITQAGGYRQDVGYGWLVGGFILFVVVLLSVLQLAKLFDRAEDA